MEDYFAVIEDPRHQGYVKYKLSHILYIVMCAVLCGMDKLCDIMIFAENREEFLKEHLGIESIPSKPTISRVLSMIDGQKVAERVISLMKEKVGTDGTVVAVDGKAIRSTSKDGERHSALQIITAYMTENGVVLGQEKIHDKTNEIPVLQEMLEYLNIKDKIVTADAMHCQRETCKLIKSKGGDYLFGVKGNQGTMLEDLEYYFKAESTKDNAEKYSTTEKNGGRIEKRICKKLPSVEWFQERHDWPFLKSAFCIERIVTTAKKTTRETGYYITSADLSARRLAEIAREHWKVESLHWSLDVVFSEDACRFDSEDAHICLNALRKFALLAQKKYVSENGLKCSVKHHLKSCLMNEKLLLKVLSAI